MKNKRLTTIIGIIFSIFLAIAFAIPTYAVGNTEANVILERNVSSDNKINVFLETSKDQSITSFNISLIVESANIQEIKSVEMVWNSDISNNAELKEVTYSNSKINIYVVSKNELGNDNGNQRRIDIGTITIETENKENIDVTVRAQKDLIRIASIGHETATITNDISTMVQLQIAPRELSGEQGGDSNQGGNTNLDGDNTQGGNGNQGGNNSQGGNSQGGNSLQGGNNSQGGNDFQGEDNNLNGDSNQENNDNKDVTGNDNTNSNEKENLAQSELPKAGAIMSNVIIFSIIAIGVLILITIVIIKAKSRQSKHYNTK